MYPHSTTHNKPEEKEIVIIIGLLVIGFGIYSAYKLVELYINPTPLEPVPKGGLDQNLMKFIKIWVRENEFLLRDLIVAQPTQSLALFEQIATLEHVYLTKIINHPEASYALAGFNAQWHTNFATFSELFAYLKSIPIL